jgi:hypothetical protein
MLIKNKIPRQYFMEDFFEGKPQFKRDDIEKLSLNERGHIYVGSDDREAMQSFKTTTLPKLKSIFKDLKPSKTYIELSSTSKLLTDAHDKDPHAGNALTSCYNPPNNDNYAIIHIRKSSNKNLAIITHELVHASRCVNKHRITNTDRDEAETALETATRLPLPYLKERMKDRNYFTRGNTGYYGLVGGSKAVLHDKKIITESCKNTNNLRSCIQENIHKTKIGKMKEPPNLLTKPTLLTNNRKKKVVTSKPKRKVVRCKK